MSSEDEILSDNLLYGVPLPKRGPQKYPVYDEEKGHLELDVDDVYFTDGVGEIVVVDGVENVWNSIYGLVPIESGLYKDFIRGGNWLDASGDEHSTLKERMRRYGSYEGAMRAEDARIEDIQNRPDVDWRGRYKGHPTYGFPRKLDTQAYLKGVQEAGDYIGYVPHPVTQGLGSGMYIAGALGQEKPIEALGGAAGIAAGSLGRHYAKRAIPIVREAASVAGSEGMEKAGEFVERSGPEQTELLRDYYDIERK